MVGTIPGCSCMLQSFLRPIYLFFKKTPDYTTYGRIKKFDREKRAMQLEKFYKVIGETQKLRRFQSPFFRMPICQKNLHSLCFSYKIFLSSDLKLNTLAFFPWAYNCSPVCKSSTQYTLQLRPTAVQYIDNLILVLPFT